MNDVNDLAHKQPPFAKFIGMKITSITPERVTAEFHELALGTPLPISSAHGENVRDLVDIALELCPAKSADDPTDADAGDAGSRNRVANGGTPTVGK